MTNIEYNYYKELFSKLTTLDEIRQYMPNYIKILEFKGMFKFKEYCETNHIDLGDFRYAYITIKDLFDTDKTYYIIHNMKLNMYLFCSDWTNLTFKVFVDIVCKIPDCTFISSQPPFDEEQYRTKLLAEAIQILENYFDIDDLNNFIKDNT